MAMRRRHSVTVGNYVSEYRQRGYAVVRGVFGATEIAAIAAAADEVHAEGLRHGRSFRHGNLFFKVIEGECGASLVPMVQWVAWQNRVLDAGRIDPRIGEILGPLIGGDLKQIINQVHWKAPGGQSDFGWHQDSRFRLPAEAYRNLGASYIQTGLAIDPHTPESGCMRFVPGSHLRGDIDLDTHAEVLGRSPSDAAMIAAGYSPDDVVDIVLAPGDLALFNPYLIHGSGSNASDRQRRLYINGYVRAEDCDRGEWAFRGGQPVPLGAEPVLVHYEGLEQDRAPRYV